MTADKIAGGNRRDKPYIWVTWLRDLISNPSGCQWKHWYISNFRYAKKQDEGDGSGLKKWTQEHDTMTAARVTKLKKKNKDQIIRVEDENSFKLRGQSGAVLSGKPDIVVLHDQRVHIIDEKSGSVRAKDRLQVLIYMFALPFVWASGWKITGEVEYRGDPVLIPEVTNIERDTIIAGMKIISSSIEPPRVPSVKECRFCKILHCPDRMKTPKENGLTNLF